MSEQEKKSGGAADSPVVLVEQSAASRHKQPFRPIEMQEDVPKELQHKRSKAPAVPSVTEELKDSVNTESKGKLESMSSEKPKHVAKKLSSATKRRASSPETITLAPLTVELKKDSIATSQPIPASVSPHATDSALLKRAEKEKDDEDSITEDIADLRTPEVAKVSSEWSDNCESTTTQKKEVSWNDYEYLTKVKLKEPTAKPCLLERKSSLGPCFRVAAPFGRPSGIAICLAKKCAIPEMEDYTPAKSMISISLSKRCLVNKTIYREPTIGIQMQKKKNTPISIQIQDAPKGNVFGTLKEKISIMGNKIKNTFS